MKIFTEQLVVHAVILAVVYLAIEFSCFVFFGVFEDRFTYYNPRDYLIEEEHIEIAKKHYDRELGWLKPYDTKFGERPPDETISSLTHFHLR